MAATATELRPTAATISNHLLQRVILSLSLSPASKVIVKRHGGCGGSGGGAFRCKTCGRAFATFQALGGHRTSHKRPLVRAHGLDLLLGARPGKGTAAAAAASDVHRCTACGAMFPTGQALGGHMRHHRAATAAAFDVAMAVSAGKTTARVVVDALSSSQELVQGESEDDDARSIRLFKFI